MRRASPLPFPAYPTPPTPWQPTSNSSPLSPANASSSSLTTGTGKTSQVIEKLTAENDRLRRELKAERAAKDELLQQQRVLKALVDQLEDKNSTLKHQFDTHDGALARKERRLDDLKAHLETEVGRRKRAEEREAEMGRKLGETNAEASRQVAVAKMAMKHSESAYQTVSKEYLDLRTKIGGVVGEFREFRRSVEDQRRERERRLMQLEVLLDQKRQAMEHALKVNREQAALLEQYKEEIGDAITRKEEMIETTHKMRWLIGLHAARNPGLPPEDETSDGEGS
jgi:chromosome segregation ATPase